MKLWNEIVNIIMYIWLTFIKICRAVFKIFEKALKIKNCSKFIMAVMLRKSFSIKDLVRKKFMLYRFQFFWYIFSMEISITCT